MFANCVILAVILVLQVLQFATIVLIVAHTSHFYISQLAQKIALAYTLEIIHLTDVIVQHNSTPQKLPLGPVSHVQPIANNVTGQAPVPYVR